MVNYVSFPSVRVACLALKLTLGSGIPVDADVVWARPSRRDHQGKEETDQRNSDQPDTQELGHTSHSRRITPSVIKAAAAARRPHTLPWRGPGQALRRAANPQPHNPADRFAAQ